jgi:DNA replication protein
MKAFSGFPAGKIEVTPLPNLFFSELLPSIDDLGELKVTLHIFWLLSRSKIAFIRAKDLRADRLLMESLETPDATPEQALQRALDLAIERRTLLLVENDAGDALLFLNTERGRREFEKIQNGDFPRSTVDREPAVVQDRPNIFALYEQNMGLMTPMLAEELKEAETQYPAEWIAEAFKLAVENNKRSWSYARKILERWQTEGRGAPAGKKSWYDKYDKFVNR